MISKTISKTILILISVFFTFEILPSVYSVGNEAPEDILKNPAVSSFSKSSWLMLFNYEVYEIDNSSVNIELSGSQYDYKKTDDTHYRGTFLFGFINTNDKYAWGMILGSNDNLLEYNISSTTITNGVNTIKTDEKEIKAVPELNFIFSKRISNTDSLGFKINTKYNFTMKESNDEDNALNTKKVLEIDNKVIYSFELGYYFFENGSGSKAGISISSGEFMFRYIKYAADNSANAYKGTDSYYDYFSYISSPTIVIGTSVNLTKKFIFGLDAGIGLPLKYENSKLKYVDPPTNDILEIENDVEKAFVFLMNFNFQYKFSKEFSMYNSYSIVNAYQESIIKSNKVGSLKINFFKTELGFIFKSNSDFYTEFAAQMTHDTSYMEEKIADISTNIDARKYKFKVHIAFAKSY